MGNKIIRFLLILIIPICLNGQYKNVNIAFDDRLLRSDEKQEIFSLKQNINQFLTATTWDEAYSDLGINLHIQIIFENSQTKGNVKIYNCQSLFSNGGDLRYFDKQVQFYYNSGTSLYFDPVLFEPLPGFLAYYAYIILAGEIDTYEYNGGNNAYETAREIAQRGTASDYKKGWGNRISIIDDINRNIGLRKARLAFYIGQDLYNNGDIKGSISELKLMLEGLEQSYIDVGRDHNTQYFLKIRSNAITSILSSLDKKDMLIDMQGLDPDRLDFYEDALDLISE